MTRAGPQSEQALASLLLLRRASEQSAADSLHAALRAMSESSAKLAAARERVQLARDRSEQATVAQRQLLHCTLEAGALGAHARHAEALRRELREAREAMTRSIAEAARSTAEADTCRTALAAARAARELVEKRMAMLAGQRERDAELAAEAEADDRFASASIRSGRGRH